MAYIRRQIDSIQTDPALRAFGAALCLVNVLTAIYWLGVPLSAVLDKNSVPICWPIFPQCAQLRVVEGQAVTLLTIALLVASCWNAVLFTQPTSVARGYWLLVGLSALKYVLILQDFRLTLNHHYMAACVLAAFLFAPQKRHTTCVLVVTMYFWAGILKVDPASRWLEAGEFYGTRPFGLEVMTTSMARAYVICLELVIVWGVLARSNRWFLFSFVQLILFHIGSFWVVGYFYPVLMFLLLSVLPLTRYLAPSDVSGGLLAAQPVSLIATAPWIGLFSLLQLVRFMFPGDPAITGEGRLLALNMFDAPIECRATGIARPAPTERNAFRISVPFLNPRTWCDPIVYLGFAQAYCRRNSGELDLYLETRRIGDPAFRPVISLPSVCALRPQYDLWRHNWWIISP